MVSHDSSNIKLNFDFLDLIKILMKSNGFFISMRVGETKLDFAPQ